MQRSWQRIGLSAIEITGYPALLRDASKLGFKMNDMQWREFFITCINLLGGGEADINSSPSWCSWTTFKRLSEDTGYWQSGLPHLNEIKDHGTTDGGTWGQPFNYQDIAHFIIPRAFTRELRASPEDRRTFERVKVNQDIEALSKQLTKLGVPHTLSAVALEVRLC